MVCAGNVSASENETTGAIWSLKAVIITIVLNLGIYSRMQHSYIYEKI